MKVPCAYELSSYKALTLYTPFRTLMIQNLENRIQLLDKLEQWDLPIKSVILTASDVDLAYLELMFW